MEERDAVVVGVGKGGSVCVLVHLTISWQDFLKVVRVADDGKGSSFKRATIKRGVWVLARCDRTSEAPTQPLSTPAPERRTGARGLNEVDHVQPGVNCVQAHDKTRRIVLIEDPRDVY